MGRGGIKPPQLSPVTFHQEILAPYKALVSPSVPAFSTQTPPHPIFKSVRKFAILYHCQHIIKTDGHANNNYTSWTNQLVQNVSVIFIYTIKYASCLLYLKTSDTNAVQRANNLSIHELALRIFFLWTIQFIEKLFSFTTSNLCQFRTLKEISCNTLNCPRGNKFIGAKLSKQTMILCFKVE